MVKYLFRDQSVEEIPVIMIDYPGIRWADLEVHSMNHEHKQSYFSFDGEISE